MQEKVAGNKAEALAKTFLSQHNINTVKENYRIDGGEVDLIARDKNYWVFVEVKYRANEKFASILEQITPQQCRRIRYTARHYLMTHNIDEHTSAIRFDVIGISGSSTEIEWIKDAF
ncbi:YraN family protein [Idiomarina sp. X4]|uniref:YraN family protein n=1 Tax=unclassified Idiomarina TaxID=2614829 RepID=UPI000C28C9D2|nr:MULTISPECIES: YraN family protein [unclassified Idiomarina]ATZ72830.1 YraN family protein [Idiomarina sp. X4]RXS43140.1 YraN family protein [Idiomarina sp. 29L]